MKLTLLFFAFIFFNKETFASESPSQLGNTYEEASLPNFLPWVGKGLAGRCYPASGSNKKSASVLMVSFEESGFEIAPFDAERKPDNFFDKMGYEEILKKFPVIKKMFLEVSETADGAVIESEKGELHYRSELREGEKYIIMRVFQNEKLLKFCNYRK